MKKRTVSGIMLTLLLVGMLMLASNIQPVKAESKTIYVDDDNTAGPWDGTPGHPYQNMTSALGHASEGDTIYVYNGTYYERITVSNSLRIIGENKSNTIIDGSNIGPVIKVVGNNVTISGFTVRNVGPSFLYVSGSAVILYYAKSCCINNNMVLDSRYGITSYYGKDNIISDNVISETNQGIPLYLSSNETVFGNDISDGVQVGDDPPYGIQVYESTNNTVVGNTVTNISYTGIRLTYSTGNLVSGNIVSNTSVGISASYISFSNTIVGNNASKNDVGIEVAGVVGNSDNNTVIGNTVVLSNVYGVYLEESNGTILYHNNFINNAQQLYTYEVYETVWDNGCEGNYWSDYTGVDIDGDGVGDTLLPHQGVDYYPLMNPYIPGDVNHDAIVDIFDLVLVAIAYDSTPGDINWNCHCDSNGDGIIDIFDLVKIAIHYGETYP